MAMVNKTSLKKSAGRLPSVTAVALGLGAAGALLFLPALAQDWEQQQVQPTLPGGPQDWQQQQVQPDLGQQQVQPNWQQQQVPPAPPQDWQQQQVQPSPSGPPGWDGGPGHYGNQPTYDNQNQVPDWAQQQPPAPGNGNQQAYNNQAGGSGDADIQTILNLVNQHRRSGYFCSGEGKSYGAVPDLQLNANMTQAAQGWTDTMNSTGNFTHGPEGAMTQRIKNVCPQTSAWGENIGCAGSASRAVEVWMNSTDGHCGAIMSPDFNIIGIGKAIGGECGGYWTLTFSRGC